MTVDRLDNPEDAKKFLRGLGLHIDEGVVRQVMNFLSGKAHGSLYSLYAMRPGMPRPLCGKGTVYKIKKLYDKGELERYSAYLSLWPTVGEAKIEQIEEAEQKAPKEVRIEQRLYVETPHKQKMRELAGYLIQEIQVPWIGDSFIISLKPGQLTLGRDDFPIIISQDNNIEVPLGVTKAGKLSDPHEALRSHLKTGGLSQILDKIEVWREGVGDNLLKCHKLVGVVQRRLERAYNVSITKDHRGQTGLTMDFPITVCADAIEQARGSAHFRDFPYVPEGRDLPYGRKGGVRKGFVLRFGVLAIYLGRTKRGLKQYERAHRELRKRCAAWKQAKDIAKQREELDDIRAEIWQLLQKFSDMERLPGQCEFCG